MKNIKYVRYDPEEDAAEYVLMTSPDVPYFVKIKSKDLGGTNNWYCVIVNRDITLIDSPILTSSLGNFLYFRSFEAAEMCADMIAEEHLAMKEFKEMGIM